MHAISGVFEFLSHENPPKIALICIIEILIILQFIVHVCSYKPVEANFDVPGRVD